MAVTNSKVSSSSSSSDDEHHQQINQSLHNNSHNEKEKKRERKRLRVCEEIISSEHTYQNHIRLIVQFFEQPLRECRLIPEHVIYTIFSNIKQIISINNELSLHIQSKTIGKAFLEMAPFFKLYSTYANNHERALATLIEWEQKCPEFGAFRRHQEEVPDMNGLKLNALLITPVQRIPRYKLLLEELLHYTLKSDEDYASIEEACKQVSLVAAHINEHIKQQDNFMKMLAIQKSLSGPVAPKILTPGRIFIKDGPLKKVCRKGGRSVERMFFLFSDILMYAKQKLLDSGAHHSYICCCIMPLQHCMVARVFGQCKGQQGSLFTISCKTESVLLYSDQQTVDAWISALTKHIGQLVKNRASLRKESSAKAPLRRTALAKLNKMEKVDDPLGTAMRKGSPQNSPNKTPKRPRTPQNGRSLHSLDSTMNVGCLSPRKRLQNMDFPRIDIGCLSPRSRMKKKKVKKEQSLDIQHIPNSPAGVDTIDLDQHVETHQRTPQAQQVQDSNIRKTAWSTPTESLTVNENVDDHTSVSKYMKDDKANGEGRDAYLPEFSIPNTPDVDHRDTDNYDYNNYVPSFAHRYSMSRTPTYPSSRENVSSWTSPSSKGNSISNLCDFTQDIHRFDDDDEENDSDISGKRVSNEMSLTEEDLQGLFEAADALDSSLHSLIHSQRESCSTGNVRRKPRYSLSRVVPPEPTSTPEPPDDYDYNNYVPKFAMKYRTPVKGCSDMSAITESPQMSEDSTYIDSPGLQPFHSSPAKKDHHESPLCNSSPRKRVSYIQAVQEQEGDADCVDALLSAHVPLPGLGEPCKESSVSLSGSLGNSTTISHKSNSMSINSSTSSSTSGNTIANRLRDIPTAVKEHLPTLDDALDAARNLNFSPAGNSQYNNAVCNLQ